MSSSPNPPYVCSDGLCDVGRLVHTWDGGLSGRAVLNRVCRTAPSLLAPGGVLLLVQSALCGVPSTIHRLCAEGLKAAVIARRQQAVARSPVSSNAGRIRRSNSLTRAVPVSRCSLNGWIPGPAKP
jgi:hypothetical protein